MWTNIVQLMCVLWTNLVRIARVLWACRISVISAGLGLLLFICAVQAQNLFADIAWNAKLLGAICYWAAVFTALFFIWAFPVHYGARWTLNHDDWLMSPKLRRKLKRACEPEKVENLVKALRADHACFIKCVPRFLGLVPFLAFEVGILCALSTQWSANGLPQGQETLTQLYILLATNIIVAVLFWIFIINRTTVVASLNNSLQESRSGTVKAAARFVWERFAWISLIATCVIVLLAYFAPFWSATFLPRALLIPFLFGSPVLILSWGQHLSHLWSFPLLAAGLGVILPLTGLNRHFNDLRTFAPIEVNLTKRQIDFSAAVERWKSANDCAAPATCPPALVIAIDGGASRAAFAAATFIGEILDRMPPPHDRARRDPARRIFAMSGVSGGALGAAVIRTALADALPDPARAPPCRNAHRTWFRAGEIFARKQAFSWRDCLQALVSGDYLSPAFIGLGFRDNLAPARYIVGGPSLIADRAALLEEAFERHYDYVVGDHQRAGEKQQSIRGIDGATGLRRRFGYLPITYAEAGEDKSWLPLLLLNSTSVQTGRRIIASDLSSTFKGQNGPVGLYSQAYDLFEVMSSLCNAPNFEGQNCPAADQSKASSTVQLDAPDVLLSTAALTSARFPILSPAGAFVIKDQPKYGDRLVDGGYFENSGDSTALDIAKALIAHSIQPIILSISNNPEEPIANIAVPRRPAVTPFVGASSNGLLARVLGILSVPFETLVSTRDGHAAEAKDLADKTLANCGPTCAAPGFFKLGVLAQPNLSVDTAADPGDHERCKDVPRDAKVHVTALSMSWWLSASVQAEIDAQRCDKDNRATLSNLMLRLSPQENAAR